MNPNPKHPLLLAFRLRVCLVVLLGAGALPLGAAELTFERDIRPILKTHCFHCHGEGEAPKAGVDLRLRRFMDFKAEHGTVVVPGRPAESLMLKLILAGEMPKGEKKLSPKEVATLESWIESGARTARPEPLQVPKGFWITEEERQFWSFQPIRRPEIPAPAVNGGTVRNPIDAFISAKLKEQKLAPAPEADRRTLIRRASIDLLGFPPTPEAVENFANDSSPLAYEHLIDRLLDSPQYGERWGRHWLDVAGYADSNGYADADSQRAHAWRYRDYVIESINRDKPFDRFIQEQLAGDELEGLSSTNVSVVTRNPRALERLTATGFLRMGPDGTGDGVPDEPMARNAVVAETIKVVSSSLLGLTIGCAQCHDHRYEPISHADYYRVRAIFEPAYDWKQWRRPVERLVSLYSSEDRAKAEAIEAEARKIDASADAMRRDFLEKVFERELKRLPDGVRESAKVARNMPREKRSAEQVALLKQYPAVDVQGALDLYDPESQKKVLAEQGKASQLRATKPAESMVMGLTEVAGRIPDTFRFARGDHEQPKEVVAASELEVLGGQAVKPPAGVATSGRRLSYARWLTSGKHPLVARVLVNRFWMHHMGRGIVSTLGDFGQNGERPTHPELLDWLAAEFMASGWKLKSFHRLVMTSATYRQAGQNEASSELDPENRWYARYKLRRMDAETLRDSVLATVGRLNLEAGGPPVPIAQDGSGRVVAGKQRLDGRGDPTIVDPIGNAEFRRSVYLERRRSLPTTVLDTFDAPVMNPNCENRPQTTVAPQSLMMLNDSFVLAQSRFFAERLQKQAPDDRREQVRLAWQSVFAADPPPEEWEQALGFLTAQEETIHQREVALTRGKKSEAPPAVTLAQTLSLASLCQVLLCENRFLYIE